MTYFRGQASACCAGRLPWCYQFAATSKYVLWFSQALFCHVCLISIYFKIDRQGSIFKSFKQWYITLCWTLWFLIHIGKHHLKWLANNIHDLFALHKVNGSHVTGECYLLVKGLGLLCSTRSCRKRRFGWDQGGDEDQDTTETLSFNVQSKPFLQ